MTQRHQRQGEGRDERKRRAAEERQITGAINSLHRDYSAAQQKRQQGDEEHIKWSRRAAISAIIYSAIAALIFGGAVYSAFQTLGAIEAANRSAEAATQQANIAADTEHRQLRAYVGIHRGADPVDKIIKMTCPDCKNTNEIATTNWVNYFTYVVKNYGATPAYHPFYCSGIIPIPTTAKELSRREAWDQVITPCTKLHKTSLDTNPTLWPHEQRVQTNIMHQKELDALRAVYAGKAHAFIVAILFYEDVFKEEHGTYMCFEYIFWTNVEGVYGCGSRLVSDY